MVTSGAGAPGPFTAEIYDPATDAWLAAPDLLGYHATNHTATLLPSGAVFVFGGGGWPGSAEVYQ